MSGRRNIAVFTGNRAEYGLLSPILQAIRSHKGLDLSLIVGGAHLDAAYGRTKDEISADGFEIAAELPLRPGLDTARAIGQGVLDSADVLDRLKPDLLVVYGDRFEAFAALLAATQSNLPTAHIEGGDKTEGGALDDSVRHAMTKLAHIHLATNPDAAWRIRAMGEEPWRVHDVGLPVIDRIKAGDYPGRDEVAERLELDLSRPVLLFTQHSITTEPDRAADQVRPSLAAMDRAIDAFGAQVVATYPNNDDGGAAILSELTDWADGRADVRLRQSLGRALYHGVLAVAGEAGACLGNSSSGLKETPAFGCPTVNIGARQSGRLAAGNVLHVGYDADAIFAAIDRCLNDAAFRELARTCPNPYGEGDTGPRVADILAGLDLSDPGLLQKKLTLDP
ncbi:UDP-N-acetylglucosamine 2-epimerase (hydrolyzing) [Alphaproteobacteria bacterium GH1-50]|uniref:UDP-N-acetylglucosamine 2-epimerase (Hydrolyzing) n=1 Tax=Kangsaoukella pontilimi TaxID=2691042 RepID=A0A7C9IHL2_9RHOB|nr:UDP-N-acetylglucosamine 2-epimerase [Kangsaoukella pontilimi]MXQ09148.1 UDP-N-acetylglucosamine 2-epimerase (hydrolyzing) [Kangsaoukella pontilimi]